MNKLLTNELVINKWMNEWITNELMNNKNDWWIRHEWMNE